MTLNKIKNMKSERGFTIVELLIVIVVIGILAAITIVAYNGVQSRARTTEAQANAKEVLNKSEVFAADAGNGAYPADAAAFKLLASPNTAALSPKVNALLGTALPASGTPTAIKYVACGTTPNFTGAKVTYWNYSTPGVVTLNAGSATGTGDTC